MTTVKALLVLIASCAIITFSAGQDSVDVDDWSVFDDAEPSAVPEEDSALEMFDSDFPGPSVCSRNPLSQLRIGGCPNKCQPFSVSSIQECAKLQSAGCSSLSCGSTKEHAVVTRCAVKPEEYKNVSLCAGNTLFLDGVDRAPVSYNVDIRIPPAEVQYKKTDIFIIADLNNGDVAAEKARNIAHRVLDTFQPYKGLQFGFGILRRQKRDKDGFLIQSKLTPNVHLVKSLIEVFPAEITGEPNLFALETASKSGGIGWRKDSNRILLYIAERPFQEPSAFQRRCLTRDNVIKSLTESHITTIPVNLGDVDGFPSRNTFHKLCGSADRGQATAFAKATGGEVVNGKNQEKVLAAIKSRVEEVPTFKYLNLDISDCHGLVKSVKPKPAFPHPVVTGKIFNSFVEVSLKKIVCHKPPQQCTLQYLLDGKKYTSVKLKVRNIMC